MSARSNGHLQKHYGALSKRERIAALFAAAGREDKEEITALVRAAPRVRYSVADHAGLFNGLVHMAYYYLLEQLETAHTLAVIALMGEPYPKRRARARSKPLGLAEDKQALYGAGMIAAYTIQTRAQAFAQVCAEHGIDPHVIIYKVVWPGGLALEFASAVVKEVEITRESAEFHASNLPENIRGELVTVEGVAAHLRELIAAWGE